MATIETYGWSAGSAVESHDYLTPAVLRILSERVQPGARVLDLGCGNANMTARLACVGYDVLGVEPSSDGVAAARTAYPDLRIEQASAYEDLRAVVGPLDAIVSAEVIEHLYSPHLLAKQAYAALQPGGHLIVTTPYHGYLKNLALSLAGKWDHHFTVLEEHTHIKFFSMRTLGTLLTNAGFTIVEWRRVGRVPALAKSMIAVARKPSS